MYVMCLIQSCPGLEQYSIVKFAESLEVVPKALSENAGAKVYFFPNVIRALVYSRCPLVITLSISTFYGNEQL